MDYKRHFSLKDYTTFKTPGFASHFFSFKSEAELMNIIQRTDFESLSDGFKQICILGKGSNVLLVGDVEGVVLKNKIEGMEVISENEDHVLLKVGAGNIWHELVMDVIDRNWGGLENLALIPGTVGAAPVQNIGAYGVELKDVFHSLTCWHFEDKKWLNLSLEDCHFAYRDSIFKQEWKNKTVITSVTFKLTKKAVLNIDYGALRTELEKEGIINPTLKEVATMVMKIRNSKIPAPEILPNAGSFFKNPTITNIAFEKLQKSYPDMPFYKQEDGWKIPAGWLLEKANWRGYSEGGVGCYENQALIIIRLGSASGRDILSFSEKIQQSVAQKFGIMLEREVNVIGNN